MERHRYERDRIAYTGAVVPSIRCIYQLSYAWPAVAAPLSLSLSLFPSVRPSVCPSITSMFQPFPLRRCEKNFVPGLQGKWKYQGTSRRVTRVLRSSRESGRRCLAERIGTSFVFSYKDGSVKSKLQDTVCGTIRESSESRDDYRLPMKFAATWTNINEVGYLGFTIIFRRLRQLPYFCLPPAAPSNR